MNKKDIDAQIQKEQEKFYDEVYAGKIPVNFKDLFRKAVMALSIYSHKINFYKVKSIDETASEKLTNGDLFEMRKTISNVPLIELFGDEDFEHVVFHCIKIQKFFQEYNEKHEEFRKQIEMKRANMEQLANIASSQNGMRIIPQA